MNWVDLVLAAVIVFNVGLGIAHGVFREVLSLAGIVIGVFAGIRGYEAIGWHVEGFLGTGPGVANLVAFVLIFAVIVSIFYYLGHLLHKAATKLFVGWLDRTGGGVFGTVKGLLFASVISLVLALFPFTDKLENDLNSSILGPHVVKFAPALYGTVMGYVRGGDYEGLDVMSLLESYGADASEETEDETLPDNFLPEEKDDEKE
jgi:membrane protein required for colicin V production